VKKYILGGGITGLIWGFYNKEFLIISQEVGGQYNSKFSLGPRYLEVTEFSEKLLNDLKIVCEKKIIKVGYWDANEVSFINEPSEEFRVEYFKKSRGAEKFDGDITCMNSEKQELTVFDIDLKDIVESLKKKLVSRIIYNKVEKININQRSLSLEGTDKSFYYSKLISTIPMKIFLHLAGKKKELLSKAVTYVLLEDNFFDMKSFDFVYSPYTDYHRITKTKEGLVVDLLGEHSGEECKKKFDNVYKDSAILFGTQIINIDKLPKYKNVTFPGRYGAWNRKYKTEQVVKEATEYANKS